MNEQISELAWKIMCYSEADSDSYKDAERIWVLTACDSIVGDRPLKIKVSYIIP